MTLKCVINKLELDMIVI